jgi:hypothetical protein
MIADYRAQDLALQPLIKVVKRSWCCATRAALTLHGSLACPNQAVCDYPDPEIVGASYTARASVVPWLRPPSESARAFGG